MNKTIFSGPLFKKALFPLALLMSLTSASTFAYEAGDIILRFGATIVDPDDSSSDLIADNLGNLTSALGTTTGVGVDSNTQPGITATYMLSNNLGLELLAATPFKHNISAIGVDSLGVTSVGKTKQLPPTLSLLYFPMQSNSAWQPFIGLGLNYTLFFENSTSSNFESVFGDSGFDLDNSFGLAARIGVDYNFDDNWGVSASVWWIDIDSDAVVTSPTGVGLGVTRLDVKAQIDPTVFMFGLNYKF